MIFSFVIILSFIFLNVIKRESNFNIYKALGVSLLLELAVVPDEGGAVQGGGGGGLDSLEEVGDGLKVQLLANGGHGFLVCAV